MNGWVIAIGMALMAFVALIAAFKLPRGARLPLAGALIAGLAGFGWQARPAQGGAPKQSAEHSATNGAALVAARQRLAGDTALGSNRWLVIGDALARNGQFGDAAGIVLGAVEHDPNNADGWLALANDLTAHAEGNLSPAARFAYLRAEAADPALPGPPFFLGLALAQSGKFTEGRAEWAGLLARTPPDAPWRADLTERLARLDAFIAAQNRPVAGSPQ